LLRQRKSHAAARSAAGSARVDAGYGFTDALGAPISPDWVSERFDALVKVAGPPRITLHGTRHTAATLMLAAGVQPKVVQEMLGRSHVSITLAIYGHVTPSMGREAGAALSANLLGDRA
jgi:integrase